MAEKSEKKGKYPRYTYSEKYYNDYDLIRPFLRFVSYGCFHKGDYKRMGGFSSSLYDLELKYARYTLPPDKLQHYQKHHKRRHILRGDSYHTCDNFLAASYGMKKLSPRIMFFLWGLLQILVKYKRIESKGRIPVEFAGAELPSPDWKDETVYWDYDGNDCKAALELLASEGYIVRTGKVRSGIYELQPELWSKLTEREAGELLLAIGVYRNMSLLGMPGYNLSMKLVERFPSLKGTQIPCQFKNAAFSRLLDDEVMERLLLAAESRRLVSFRYNNSMYLRENGKQLKRKKILPLRLQTDYYGGGRQYVLTGQAKGLGNFCERFRIEGISELKERSFLKAELKERAEAEEGVVQVRFHVSGRLGERIKQRVLDLEPLVKCVAENEEGFICEFGGYDKVRLIPLLRRFFPYAEILSAQDNDGLRKRVGADLKEALENYGII